MRLALPLALLCCCAVAWTADLRLVAQFAADPRAGDLLTWHLEGAPADWLQADVTRTPSLTITGPDGRTWTRRCYLDQAWKPAPAVADGPEFAAIGQPFLAVRHTPRLAGIHRWALWTPDGKPAGNGEVRVGEAQHPVGPVRISRDNPRLLAWPDGTPQLLIGPNLGWAAAPDRAADYARYCALLKENGCTHVRTWMASWAGQPQGDQPGEIRLDHAWLMDQELAAARANGIMVTVVLENFHDILSGKCAPWGASADERVAGFIDNGPRPGWLRVLDYCLARWGADDTILAWEPFNEIDMAQPVREKALEWTRKTLAWLKQADQDERLLTCSWCGDDWPAAMALPQVDLVQVRGYVYEWTDVDWRLKERTHDALAMFDDAFDQAQKLGKPWILAEVGYQGSETDNRGNELDDEGLLLRQTLWSGFLLGGCGGGMNWWWDVYVDKRKLWGIYRGMARCVARIDWKDPRLVPLTPNRGGPMRILGWASAQQALLWPSHVADNWYDHIGRGKVRPKPIQPVTAGLAGFAKSVEYRVTPLDMLSGDARQPWVQKSDGQGRLQLVIPPGTIDTVFLVEKVK